MIVVIVSVLFTFYVFFEALSVICRFSASTVGKNAIGASLEKMMNTIKRIFIFSYPPMLGYMISQGDYSNLYLSIFLSYLLSSIVLILVFVFQNVFKRYFTTVALGMSNRNGTLRSLLKFRGAGSNLEFPNIQEERRVAFSDIRSYSNLILLYSWIFFIYSGSIFFINIMAFWFVEFAPVILQTLGFINGLATLLLAFVIDPKISLHLDDAHDLDVVCWSVLISQLVANAVLGPLFFVGLIYFF